MNTAASSLSSVTLKVGLANLVIWLVGFAACVTIGLWVAFSFTAGLVTGILNLYLYLRMVRKGISMPIESVAGFIGGVYFVKFLLIITILALFIWKLKLTPWALLLGFVGTIMTTIVTLVFISRGETI
ncbi:MAG: ATP synthase subunit I [Deltaproteobacteria bacterium]|nr:ATP synthase subunit I [Deltaproteobacteria bacterium]